MTRIYDVCGHKIVSGNSKTDFRLNVGCADPKYLRIFTQDEVVDAVLKVGPVVDARTKKKDFERSLNDVYVQLFKCFFDISNERQVRHFVEWIKFEQLYLKLSIRGSYSLL